MIWEMHYMGVCNWNGKENKSSARMDGTVSLCKSTVQQTAVSITILYLSLYSIPNIEGLNFKKLL